MTSETHLNHRLFEFMFTRLYRYAYIFYIYYTYIYTLIQNECFITTVLPSGVCQNLSGASLSKRIVIKFQSHTDGRLPTHPPPLEHKTMHLLYICCKQTVFRAPNPQTKPPYLQWHSAVGSLCAFLGAQREGDAGRRSS